MALKCGASPLSLLAVGVRPAVSVSGGWCHQLLGRFFRLLGHVPHEGSSVLTGGLPGSGVPRVLSEQRSSSQQFGKPDAVSWG